jgi:methylated-DNA-[protein]-cysteine S-methyltransferase
MKPCELSLEDVPSPIGTLLAVGDGAALHALDFAGCEERLMRLLAARFGAVRLRRDGRGRRFGEALRAYFAGELGAIDALPIDPGGTDFQRRVWEALRTIPPGTTLSYGTLASRLGLPTAARAVGSANALNPVAIVVPCHRLVGADGRLTGYAGGLARKEWLLRHEGTGLPRREPASSSSARQRSPR